VRYMKSSSGVSLFEEFGAGLFLFLGRFSKRFNFEY